MFGSYSQDLDMFDRVWRAHVEDCRSPSDLHQAENRDIVVTMLSCSPLFSEDVFLDLK